MTESSSKPDLLQESWVALLGRRDVPTDGVEDYCTFLGRALERRGIGLERVRVAWDERGWIQALKKLGHETAAWRGRWVLLQYTALSWSRRGFPFAALAVLNTLRHGGARVAVVFHEPQRQGGTRKLDRVRGASQDWVIQQLHGQAAKSIFTVPTDMVPWLSEGQTRAAFIPIGANIPERNGSRREPSLPDDEKTVIVFGVTGAPEAALEIATIASTMRQASHALRKVRLVVVGRGSSEAREPLARALEKCNVDVEARGVLPAEQIVSEFERADALLFVRGDINPRRGSAIAGIACGLPVVGYRDGRMSGPLMEAGIEWSTERDANALARGLIRVLSDPSRWLALHVRNLDVQKNHLSWSRIAEQYRAVLAG